MSSLADPAWYERAGPRAGKSSASGRRLSAPGLPGQRHDAGGEDVEPGVVLQVAGSGRRRRPPRAPGCSHPR
jgi:hypothetical protein